MARAKPVIVVGEDDAAHLELLGFILTSRGYVPLCCRTERETLERVVAEHPALLLVDLHLDRRDSGWRIVRRLRENARTRRLPVVVCTGDLLFVREYGAPLRRLGCDLLVKPYGLQELLAKVAAASLPLQYGS